MSDTLQINKKTSLSMSSELIGSAIDAHDKVSGLRINIPARVYIVSHPVYCPSDVHRDPTFILDIIGEVIDSSSDVIRDPRTTAVVDRVVETIDWTPDIVRDIWTTTIHDVHHNKSGKEMSANVKCLRC